MEEHPDDLRPRIIHQNTPRIGEELAPETPQEAPPQPGGEMRSSKIRTFERTREEKSWKRKPNSPGTGAVHVKTFHCKLTEDALRYMDETINEWLETHPELEVKFVTSTIGVFTGKLKEPQMITQVWV